MIDLDRVQVPFGSLADEVVTKWGGTSDVEQFIEFMETLDDDLVEALLGDRATASTFDRRRVAEAWDEWRSGNRTESR